MSGSDCQKDWCPAEITRVSGGLIGRHDARRDRCLAVNTRVSCVCVCVCVLIQNTTKPPEQCPGEIVADAVIEVRVEGKKSTSEDQKPAPRKEGSQGDKKTAPETSPTFPRGPCRTFPNWRESLGQKCPSRTTAMPPSQVTKVIFFHFTRFQRLRLDYCILASLPPNVQ